MTKILKALLPMIAALMVEPNLASAGTIDGTFTFGPNEFAVIQYPFASWSAAESDVTATLGSNWHLAVITDSSIQASVSTHLASLAPTFSYVQAAYWLGGYQSPANEPSAGAGWTWVTGAPWIYTNWNAGEPNDAGGPGAEQFLEMWLSNNGQHSFGDLGKWNDLGNPADLIVVAGYIAEAPVASVPEPESWLLMLLGFGVIGARLRRRHKPVIS